MPVPEVLAVLESELEPVDFAFLMELLSKVEQTKPEQQIVLPFLSKEEILARLPIVKNSLASLKANYTFGGKIILPPRPIKEIEFKGNQLVIKFMYRDWKKIDPVNFFKKYPEIYGQMSRKELFRFDQKLYTLLLQTAQLDKAIPAKLSAGRKPISHEQRKQVIKAHSLKMTAEQAAKYAKVDKGTISRYWKKIGLKPHYWRKADNQELSELFWRCKGNTYSAAKEFGLNQSAIYQRWKRMGLVEILDKVREAYKIGLNQMQAAEYAGVDEEFVAACWKRQRFLY